MVTQVVKKFPTLWNLRGHYHINEPTTGPYPEPDSSSICHPILFPYDEL
jgi:hypothetical protein